MNTQICDAVVDLVVGGETLSSISLVSIARSTGISRNSIYRRWTSKEQLYSDVVRSLRRALPAPSAQSARENIAAILQTFELGRGGRQMEEAIVAEARNFRDLYDQYLNDVVAPRDHELRLAIRRGKETREIRSDVDEDLLLNVLRSTNVEMSRSTRDDLDSESASRRMIDLVFDGVTPT